MGGMSAKGADRIESMGVEKRQPFTQASVTGRDFANWDEVGKGKLLMSAVKDYRTIPHGDAAVYVIFSYNTPIAWCVFNGDDMEWTVPNVHYSVTTKMHQSIIRRRLNQLRIGYGE